MPSITATHDSTKDRDALWSVIADFPNIADWTSGLTSSHATSPATEGVGATRHCDLTNGAELEETIRAWEPGHSVTISIDRVTKLPLRRATSTFRIESIDGGHRLSMDTDFTPKGGPLGVVLGPLLKPALRKGNRGLLAEWDEAAA